MGILGSLERIEAKTHLPRPFLVAIAIIALLVGGAIAWYLGSPLFINKTVNEAFPMGQSAAGVLPLQSGEFGVIDNIHRGEGTASIIRLPSGGQILRFEQFKVTNGPDLYVYLSGHPAPRNREQVHQGGDLELGRLKGNIGDQNYELPQGIDLSRFKSVVIYCKQFSVVFSTAELRPTR